MSLLRKDPVSDCWVIIAEERINRPGADRTEKPIPTDPSDCPFCPGHEDQTPIEIRALRPDGMSPNTDEWSIRVIPNKYAALQTEGDVDRRGIGLYSEMNGIGAHEVVIDSPIHDAQLHEMSDQHLTDLIGVYHERVCDLSRDPRFRYIQIFRNFGIRAGASIDHPHTQIMALPIVPRWVKEELHSAKDHWERTERCLFCDIINQEKESGERVVHENDDFLSFNPFASKFPYETWIFPKAHCADVRELTGATTPSLIDALRSTLGALAHSLDNPPYNMVLHSAPFAVQDSTLLANTAADYHWHIEIIPRLTTPGGFEWGTGFHINPVAPETASVVLRQTLGKK